MAVRSDLSGDEAALLLGLVLADADGRRLPVELEALRARLAQLAARFLPDSNAVVEAWAREALASGADGVLRRLVRSLPEPGQRVRALELAVRVAFADGRMDRHEAEHIAALGAALGLPADEVRRLSRR